jgi:hypothetical protein
MKFALEQAMKVKVLFYSLFNLSGRWGWVVNATS